jgi:hypothetical protein
MSYKYGVPSKSRLTSVEKVEGEPIELKIERIVSNKEPISDGAPSIYTERKDGVVAAYNIRTDRFEIAAEGMDLVAKNIAAKRDAKAQKKASGSDVKETKESKKETKVVDITDSKVSGAKSIEGKASKD